MNEDEYNEALFTQRQDQQVLGEGPAEDYSENYYTRQGDKVMDTAPKDEASLHAYKPYQRAAKRYYDFLNPPEETVDKPRIGPEGPVEKRPQPFAAIDDPTPATMGEYAEWMTEYVSMFENNLSKMGYDTVGMANADMGAVMAFADARKMYLNTDLTWRQIGRGTKYLMQDPLTYVGTGVAGFALKKTVGKNMTSAVVDGILGRIRSRAMRAPIAVGAAEGAIFGGAYGAGAERAEWQARGRKEGEYDWSGPAREAGWGAVVGTGLTSIPLVVRHGRKLKDSTMKRLNDWRRENPEVPIIEPEPDMQMLDLTLGNQPDEVIPGSPMRPLPEMQGPADLVPPGGMTAPVMQPPAQMQPPTMAPPALMNAPQLDAPAPAAVAGAPDIDMDRAVAEWATKGEESSYFKNWTGGARVVDGGISDPRTVKPGPSDFKTGEPVVVRGTHGTEDFIGEGIDADKAGSSTRAPSAREGFFMAGSPETSNTYADGGGLYLPVTDKFDLEHRLITDEELKWDTAMSVALKQRPDLASDAGVSGMMMDVNQGDPAVGTELSQITQDIVEQIEQSPFNDGIPADILAIGRETYDLGNPQTGQNMPVYMRFKNPMVHDFKGKGWRDESYYNLILKAKEEGHDGMIFMNTADGGPKDNIFVTWDETNVKGQMQSGEFSETGDMMHGAAAAPAAAVAGSEKEEKKKRQYKRGKNGKFSK